VKRAARLLVLALFPFAGGCAAASGAGGALGGLVQLAMYLAMLVGPLYLSYYLYNKDE
jgi:hypothetical protein